MSKPITLVVDDEPAIRELLEITLTRMEILVRCAGTVSDAKDLLNRKAFDLCLTDLRLPDGDGLELVEYIQATSPALPVAVITAHGNMDAAIRALKNGAFDFLSKPVDLQVLRRLVTSALKLDSFPNQDRRTRHQLLGDSPAMRVIRSKISKVGRSQAPIYISGESGSGKELVARLIHEKSARSDKPFIPVNCGAIPSDLMESEFFGHRKGSFTGAVTDKVGLFQAAEGGSLFLDEVADLPLSLQVKLLRAIQEKAIRPIGAEHEITVDVRILSATHKILGQLVENGAFRQDLYYRINVIELNVPPLRNRREDIEPLAEHILTYLADLNRLPQLTLTDAALAALKGYAFPGNVRELENIIERAMALCEGEQIEIDDLNLPLSKTKENILAANETPLAPASLESYMDQVEKKAIINALEKTRWNRTAAAKELGISFRALRYRLKKLGLD